MRLRVLDTIAVSLPVLVVIGMAAIIQYFKSKQRKETPTFLTWPFQRVLGGCQRRRPVDAAVSHSHCGLMTMQQRPWKGRPDQIRKFDPGPVSGDASTGPLYHSSNAIVSQ